MSLSVVSLNFKTTPVELREQLAVSAELVPSLLKETRDKARLKEVMVLSTCNRVEFFFADDEETTAAKNLTQWLAERFRDQDFDIATAAVMLSGKAAVTHLFRVACSLESMVVGEPQILGQVKEAFQLAVAHKSHGTLLTGLMPRVFRAAKRVRSETLVARFPVSISFAAVQLASRIFETLSDKTVMVVGAGDMAELTVQHLLKAGIERLLITNRTFANAVALAERFQGSAVRFDELETYVPEADIVISSTGARGFIVTPEMVKKATKKRRGAPVFFIDIAVPRDVDPAVNELSDVYCYDIDDLQAVTDANKAEREREALKAQQIVEEEVAEYERWLRSHNVVPTVKALRRRFEEVGQQELEAALEKLGQLSGDQATQVRKLVRSLINKLLHEPSTRLKQGAGEVDGMLYGDALTALFALSPDGGEENAPGHHDAPGGNDEGDNVVRLPISQD
jgi:glutamyl-tRNA reductase